LTWFNFLLSQHSQSDNSMHIFKTWNLSRNLFDEILIQTLRPDQTLYTFYMRLPVLYDIPFRLAVDRAAIYNHHTLVHATSDVVESNRTLKRGEAADPETGCWRIVYYYTYNIFGILPPAITSNGKHYIYIL